MHQPDHDPYSIPPWEPWTGEGDPWKDFKKEPPKPELTFDEGWTKHTAYHWSRTLNEKRLDYWPSKRKWNFEGKIMTGDVESFVKANTLVDLTK